ncbi:hypothetical protein BC835DRAFT_1309269 [Cytidiella melzeri]|nr:hypothetical protein BC835DRAFT_1309269 [Cytidiella melzeri]
MTSGNDHIVVTGVSGVITQGTPPVRQEINDLIKNDPMGFSLYVRALSCPTTIVHPSYTSFVAIMKNDPQDLDASYFQIAGIHGQPYIAWQGAGGDQPAAPNEGYCTHSSILFPTWHRPYMALYEQILVKHAKDAAANMPAEWKQKAESFRLPYWDWAKQLTPPKEIMQSQNLDIVSPSGDTDNVENPFYNYHFNPVPDFTDGTADTFRAPTFTRRVADEIRRSTLYVLSRTNSWDAMSNDRAGDGPHPELASSLEQIHNNIHIKTGGFMADVSIAAFDPIFWMHHANVDRLLALWQAIHPKVWVSPSTVTADSDTYTLAIGSKINSLTPLAPFWDGKAPNSFWTSDDVKLVSTFGYTYPELLDNPSPAQLTLTVQALYGASSATAFATAAFATTANSPAARTLEAAAKPLAVTKVPDIIPGVKLPQGPADNFAVGAVAAHDVPEGPPSVESAHEDVEDAKVVDGTAEDDIPEGNKTGLQDWAVRVRAEKYALKTSFDVIIFLLPNDVEESSISTTDSSTWFESDYYVGSVGAFVNSKTEQCGNCRAGIAEKVNIEGFVSLNEAIIEISGLSSFDDEVVHPYLKKNLVWRVRKVSDGAIVLIQDIPSLEVSVWSSALLFVPGAAHLPTFEASKHHHSITADMAGGSARQG